MANHATSLPPASSPPDAQTCSRLSEPLNAIAERARMASEPSEQSPLELLRVSLYCSAASRYPSSLASAASSAAPLASAALAAASPEAAALAQHIERAHPFLQPMQPQGPGAFEPTYTQQQRGDELADPWGPGHCCSSSSSSSSRLRKRAAPRVLDATSRLFTEQPSPCVQCCLDLGIQPQGL